MAKIEQLLELESSKMRHNNVKADSLKIASEMFIYLNICPGKLDTKWYSSQYLELWFQAWYKFYKNLFKTESPEQIILSLNRMMKSNNFRNKDGRIMAEKLLKKTASMLSLKLNDIQSMLGKGTRNISVNDQIIKSPDCK